MNANYLKTASKTPETETGTARKIAGDMIAAIEAGGETAVQRYAAELDHWTGPIVMDEAAIEARLAVVTPAIRADIDIAIGNVRRFAEAQRRSVADFEIEVSPGLVAGQKMVPCNVAGCYVPTGRYAHIASAYMSVVTAKAAGVKTVIACSAPFRGEAVHPAVLYAMRAAGADDHDTGRGAGDRDPGFRSVHRKTRLTSSSGPAINLSPRPSGCCSERFNRRVCRSL